MKQPTMAVQISPPRVKDVRPARLQRLCNFGGCNREGACSDIDVYLYSPAVPVAQRQQSPAVIDKFGSGSQFEQRQVSQNATTWRARMRVRCHSGARSSNFQLCSIENVPSGDSAWAMRSRSDTGLLRAAKSRLSVCLILADAAGQRPYLP